MDSRFRGPSGMDAKIGAMNTETRLLKRVQDWGKDCGLLPDQIVRMLESADLSDSDELSLSIKGTRYVFGVSDAIDHRGKKDGDLKDIELARIGDQSLDELGTIYPELSDALESFQIKYNLFVEAVFAYLKEKKRQAEELRRIQESRAAADAEFIRQRDARDAQENLAKIVRHSLA